MKKLLIAILFFFITENFYAQGSAGSSGDYEPRYIVDMPTAGILGHNTYVIDANFFQSGGVLFNFSFGLLNWVNIGISYGGSELIGSSNPKMNKIPGVNFKIRPMDETKIFPAVVFGFDSQGKETYIDSLDRYNIKSPGFFLVFSKNFLAAGYLSVHGGINYSLERADGDKDANLFFGVEKTVGPFVSVTAEYNLAVNDSDPKALGKGRGYLNFGIRGSFGDGFTLGINLKDIIKNQENVNIGNRTISVEYIAHF